MIIAKQEHFSALTEEILKSGKNLRFQATGQSMHPFIKNGQVIVIQPMDSNALRTGDVVFFRNKSSESSYVAHRLIAKQKDGVLITKGDARKETDEPVNPNQVLGKVVTVEKSGRAVALNNAHNQTAGWLISKLSATRMPYLRIYRSIRGAFLKPLRPIFYSLQKSTTFRKLAARFRGAVEYGPVQPHELLMLGQLIGYWNSGPGEQENSNSKEIGGMASDTGEDCVRFVARKKNNVVGVATLSYKKPGNHFPQGWWLWGLVVRPRYRGLGIGLELISSAILEIKKRAGKDIKILVEKENLTALALYEKIGFTEANNTEWINEKWYKERCEKEKLMGLELSKNLKKTEIGG